MDMHTYREQGNTPEVMLAEMVATSKAVVNLSEEEKDKETLFLESIKLYTSLLDTLYANSAEPESFQVFRTLLGEIRSQAKLELLFPFFLDGLLLKNQEVLLTEAMNLSVNDKMMAILKISVKIVDTIAARVLSPTDHQKFLDIASVLVDDYEEFSKRFAYG